MDVTVSRRQNNSELIKGKRWKRLELTKGMIKGKEECSIKKRKFPEDGVANDCDITDYGDGTKRLKSAKKQAYREFFQEMGNEIMEQDHMEKVRRSCGFPNGIEVGAEGSRGGLCLAWKKAINVTLRNFSKNHIDGKIKVSHENENIPVGNAQFKFEAWWITEESLEKEIKDCWESNTNPILEKLKNLQIHLSDWSRTIKTKREGLKKKLTKELEELMAKDNDDDTIARIISTMVDLNMEIDRDEIYWEQRARANWLKAGDKNSAFFHKFASSQQKINAISRLQLDDGGETTDEREIAETATSYFQKLFTSNKVGDLSYLLQGIKKNILPDKNVALLAAYTEEEVFSALKGMGATKAPGLDGFPAVFFQRYWHIVGKDVTKFCLGILNTDQSFGPLNSTDIVLILKIQNPVNLANFRPISLCTVLDKIVTKVIVNRLQDVIGGCINVAQSVFIPGRLISGNVLIAYEILHTFRKKRTGKNGYMAVKLDMSKAYDRVEWGFLKEVMLKMGFQEEVVRLILKCISTVSFAVSINGKRGRVFQASRGLRQGDPLSPFLFLLCSEGLPALMRLAKKEGVRSSNEMEKYLGLPNVIGRHRKESFQNLKEKLQLRIKGWSNRIREDYCKFLVAKSIQEERDSLVSMAILVPNKRRWRSVWVAKGVLGEGICWKMGMGSAISVLHDIWIPDLINPKLSSHANNLSDCKVADLIDESSRRWKSELIESTFPEYVAEKISRIPLAVESHDDRLAWRGEPSGEFTICSAYKLLQSIEMDPRAYAVQTDYKKFYKKLWLLNLPTKIKITTWKISWNYLPTRINMQYKKLSNNVICPRCGQGAETMNHLFRECPVSRSVLEELLFSEFLKDEYIEFSQWLTWVFEMTTLPQCEMFCCVLWVIWGARNKLVHEKVSRSGKEIARFINCYILEIKGVEEKLPKTLLEVQKWKHPLGNAIKVNFDAAYDEKFKKSAVGVVARNKNEIGDHYKVPKHIKNKLSQHVAVPSLQSDAAFDNPSIGVASNSPSTGAASSLGTSRHVTIFFTVFGQKLRVVSPMHHPPPIQMYHFGT
ncbi:reverse transcriptase [Gossypium australe]|uniref:Reverse transcriptase n=1 Tax=Gossypium australe TaxID=47621 RepID=A0A5B6W8H9_9ROSI|nr:reverse transcriptase [Gossypium australe]